MWPFSKSGYTKYMRKVTLIDGQEFIGEDYVNIFVGDNWVRLDLGDNETVCYPHHRVLEMHTWREVE